MCWQAARTLASDITERGARLYDLLAQETKLQQARAKALRFLDSISGNLQSSSAENEYIERCGEMRREAGREKEGLGGGGEGGGGEKPSATFAEMTPWCARWLDACLSCLQEHPRAHYECADDAGEPEEAVGGAGGRREGARVQGETAAEEAACTA